MPRHVAFWRMSSCSSHLLSCLSLSLDIAVAPRTHVTKHRWIQVQTGLAGFAERYFRQKLLSTVERSETRQEGNGRTARNQTTDLSHRRGRQYAVKLRKRCVYEEHTRRVLGHTRSPLLGWTSVIIHWLWQSPVPLFHLHYKLHISGILSGPSPHVAVQIGIHSRSLCWGCETLNSSPRSSIASKF